MSPAEDPDVVTAMLAKLGESEAVSSVVLGGSRARGTATALSDWDIYVEGDSERMMAEIPALVASFAPLAAFWEPLSEQARYMVVMYGPTKVESSRSGGTGRSSRRGC
ncbi:MAG: nucleotidyltransferase domain-containing protein [Gaiellaceae bacterium]